jgi:hypothetical protein
LNRNLGKLTVVYPHFLAVGDDELGLGDAVVPAKAPGTLQKEQTPGLFQQLQVLVEKSGSRRKGFAETRIPGCEALKETP